MLPVRRRVAEALEVRRLPLRVLPPVAVRQPEAERVGLVGRRWVRLARSLLIHLRAVHEDGDLEDRVVGLGGRWERRGHEGRASVQVLEQIFFRSPAESTRIMLTVHRNGKGVAGTYSKEVAETKCSQTMQLARENGFPLLLSTEPE